jgi:membrane protein
VVRLVEGIWHHDDIFQMAPAMAFHFFLSLLPLLVFVGYVVGLVAQSRGISNVFGVLIQSLDLPQASERVVAEQVGRIGAVDSLGPIAALGFLWIASGGTQGLMQAIERVVGAPRRVWWRQRLLALAWVLGTMVAFAVAAIASIQWENVVHPDQPAAAEVVASPSPGVAADRPASPERATTRRVRMILRGGGERILTMAVSLLASVAGLAGFYQFSIAHSRRVRRRVFPGAFLAVGLVVVISWGFSLYVRTLASYTIYYGSLAAIAVLLIWLWLMSVAILVGAELNSQLEGLRD